jgi:hypothetical protein
MNNYKSMNTLWLKSGMVLVVAGAGMAAHAQDDGNGDDIWGRFNVSYRVGLNIKANFSGVGAFAPPATPPGGGTGYNDGFVGIDSSHNAGGFTTYWGYQNASQLTVGNDVLMSSTSGSSARTGNSDADPQNGFELSYDQPLGGGKHWHWGIEGAANWTGIGIADSQSFSGTVTTSVDAYSLGAILPPLAPYTGTVSGPGPLLNTTPIPQGSSTSLSTIIGSRDIDANLFGFRLGPYLELPVCSHLSVQLSAGLSAGVISSEFSYNETVTAGGLSPQTYAGSGHKDAGLIGGYARAQINVKLCEHLALFGGAEFNDMGTFNQTVGNETAHLNLSQSIYVNGGLSWSF